MSVRKNEDTCDFPANKAVKTAQKMFFVDSYTKDFIDTIPHPRRSSTKNSPRIV